MSEANPVDHPTYLEHIRHFFEGIDVDHMRQVAGIDLATYEGVKANAAKIYFQTSAGRMPPETDRKWSDDRVRSFRAWMIDKYPMGTVPMPALAKFAPTGSARPNASNLNTEQIALLKKAFQGLMDRSPDDPASYFALAGIHWFPVPTYCVHHEARYNPWHRAYIDRFEAALRTVPGCENIRMPYWDILSPIPTWLYEPPFAEYKLPREASPQYPAGTLVTRFPPEEIATALAAFGVKEDIRLALDAANFESFASYIEAAHDSGHVSIGPADGMGRPDLAAFDPIFWFYHCNWERMWWAWQVRHEADTLETFRSTVSDTLWIDDPEFNKLEPFGMVSAETIDATRYAYEDAPQFAAKSGVITGNVLAERTFRLRESAEVSLRVKGIERLRIRGSFVVHLMNNGQTLAQRAFFQSSDPAKCDNCVKRATVDFNFVLDRDLLAGKSIEVRIETLAPDRIDRWVPLHQVGNPTVNVRELLVLE
jgi:hypothetical protein